MADEELPEPEPLPPHAAVYDPATGRISRMFSPTTLEQDDAQVAGYIASGMSPPGSLIFYSETLIDNATQMVDINADPLAIIDLPEAEKQRD